MTTISFFTDEHGFPAYSATDDRFVPLGVWFTMELGNSQYQCLDLLAIVDDVASGRSAVARWEGEAFDVPITAAGATTHNLILDDHRAGYTLPELRTAVEDYWRFLAGRSTARSDLAAWERTWRRTHPYRGRLL